MTQNNADLTIAPNFISQEGLYELELQILTVNGERIKL